MLVNVLFVCLGNICRSPMAEALFQRMVDEAGLQAKITTDSAGTGGWHVGDPPHAGTQQILQQYQIPYDGRARELVDDDFDDDDTYIVAMDQQLVTQLFRRFGDHPHVYRLLDFATQHSERNVPDPYYSGNFDYVYELIHDGCTGLLAKVKEDVAG